MIAVVGRRKEMRMMLSQIAAILTWLATGITMAHAGVGQIIGS
jgi:hypothetical protein